VSKSLAVIKFGGGLITDKTTPFTARTHQIEHMAGELARVRSQLPDTDILLGNGAGSFGHPPAKQYSLRDGAHTAEQFYGMSVTHNGVQQLNTMVVSALIAQKLPAFSLAPSSMLACTDGEVVARNGQPLRQLLTSGCIPVVYGDTLTDTTRGTTIYSTERVLEQCLQELTGKYDDITVVYVMNASGVMDESGAVLPHLSPDYEVQVTQHAGHDVTGGITGKVAAARVATKTASRVYIIGPQPGALLAALRHEQVGTQIS
jgi:isopentenyl phosphate kinase